VFFVCLFDCFIQNERLLLIYFLSLFFFIVGL